MIALLLFLQPALSLLPPNPVEALPVPACEVTAFASKVKAGPSDLYGTCGKLGVRLASADTYRSSYNAALKSVVVVSALNGVQRVLLLSEGAGGALFVNDLTRDLTSLSGRYVEAGLVDEVDLTTFAMDGAVSVPSRPVPKDLPQGLDMIAASKVAGRELASAVPARLDLKAYVEAQTRLIGEVPASAVDDAVAAAVTGKR